MRKGDFCLKEHDEIKLDLHIHSCLSDGTANYAKIVSEAKTNGVGLISITDHDVVANLDLMKKNCAGTGLSFLTGVEFSAVLDGNLHHILGYGFDWSNEAIIKLMENNLRHEAVWQNRREEFWIKQLIDVGCPVDLEEFASADGGAKPSPGNQFKSKIFTFLIQKGIIIDKKDYFDRLFPLVAGKPFTKIPPDFPHPVDVIEVIKTAGGIPVIAHPVWTYNKLSLTDTLDLFKGFKIEGIECYRYDFNRETTDVCLKYCENNNLIITAGSDYHGNTIGSPEIGLPAITINQCRLGVLAERIIYR